MTIPIFEGFGRSYQIREAEAQTLVQQSDLADARLQAGLDVWTSFHGLESIWSDGGERLGMSTDLSRRPPRGGSTAQSARPDAPGRIRSRAQERVCRVVRCWPAAALRWP